SNILTGYGMTVEELGRANDVLVASFTSANVDLSMLGESFKYVGPVARGAGVQVEEVAAAIGLLGNAGIQGSMAGTALSSANSTLIAPSGEAAKVLARLGVTTTDAQGNMLPLADVIERLGAAGAATADMMTLFGERAGPGMVSLLGQGSAALREFTTNLEESGGLAEQVAARQVDTLRGDVKELESAN